MEAKVQNIETMVFDYLRRNYYWKELVEKFSCFQNQVFEHNSPITLETVYESYLWPKEVNTLVESNCISEQTFHPEIRIGESGVHLPELVTEELFSYFGYKELLNLRLLNKHFHQIISNNAGHGKYNHMPICFYDDRSAYKFLKTFQNQIDKSPIPFCKYNFQADKVDVLDILRLVGATTREATFSFQGEYTPTKVLTNFLAQTPAITNLTFQGYLRLTQPLSKTVTLPFLRTLKLGDAYTRNHVIITEAHIFEWFQASPLLHEFDCKFRVEMDSSASFGRLILSKNYLRLVTLTRISALTQEVWNLPKIQTGSCLPLTLTLEEIKFQDAEACSNFISTLGNAVQNLCINLCYGELNIRELQNLKCFKSSVGSTTPSTTFRAQNFPNLFKVVLVCPETSYLANNQFQGDVFPTVSSLKLRWSNVDQPHNWFTSWHVIFPALLSLSVVGSLLELHVKYIAENLTGLSKLCVTKYNNYHKGNFRIFDVHTILRNDQLPLLSWPFSNLTELKIFKIKDVSDIAQAVTDLHILTTHKIIKPLELSFIQIGNTDRNNVPWPVPPFLQNLRELGWHETVNYRFKNH